MFDYNKHYRQCWGDDEERENLHKLLDEFDEEQFQKEMDFEADLENKEDNKKCKELMKKECEKEKK